MGYLSPRGTEASGYSYCVSLRHILLIYAFKLVIENECCINNGTTEYRFYSKSYLDEIILLLKVKEILVLLFCCDFVLGA